MVTFLIAVVGLSFVSTNWNEKVILGTAWAALALFIFSTVYANWEKSTDPFRYIIKAFLKHIIKEVEEEASEIAHKEKEILKEKKVLLKKFRLWKKFKRHHSSAHFTKEE